MAAGDGAEARGRGRGAADRRREFLRRLARVPLLGALGLAGAGLLARGEGRPLHPDEACANRGVCRGCGILDECSHPQAALSRRGLKYGRR